MRTDDNNNPAAFTTAVAHDGGLQLGVDYVLGTPFPVKDKGVTYYTAHLLGDSIALTIRVIDAIGYYTKQGLPRWTYIAIPKFVWDGLSADQKRDVIGFHYKNEGGTRMRGLFPRL